MAPKKSTNKKVVAAPPSPDEVPAAPAAPVASAPGPEVDITNMSDKVGSRTKPFSILY